MKFLCDRCKTRYSIGDDRVRGKILKIRCKNCANVITVREGMTDADAAAEPEAPRRNVKPTTISPPIAASTPSSLPTAAVGNGAAVRPQANAQPGVPNGALGAAFASAMTRPPPALEEEWYVSIDGDQEGPYSLVEAQRWISAKAFDADLHCWSEGFDDWLPVDKVSHFRGLRKKPAPPAAPPPLPRATGGVPALRAQARPAVEEEPKPLFAATMASLEKNASGSVAALGMPAPAMSRPSATPPRGEPRYPSPIGGTPSIPSIPSGIPSIQARTNGSATGPAKIPSVSPLPTPPSTPAVMPGAKPALPGPARVRPETRPGAGAPAAVSGFDVGDQATQIEAPPFEQEAQTKAEPVASNVRNSSDPFGKGLGRDSGPAKAITPPVFEPPVPAPQVPAPRLANAPITDESEDDDADDSLSIGEVSRVVKLADLVKPAPKKPDALSAAAAQRRTGSSPALQRTGAMVKLGNTAAVARIEDPGFAPNGIAADPSAPGTEMAMVPAPVAHSHKRGMIILIGVSVVLLAGVIVAVVMLAGEDTVDKGLGRTDTIDTSRPDDPLRPRQPGETGGSAGSAVATNPFFPTKVPVKRPNTGSNGTNTTGSNTNTNPELPTGDSLTPEDIDSVSKKYSSGTQRCYMRSQKGVEAITVGNVKSIGATLTIAKDGAVTEVVFTSHGDDSLGKCLNNAIRGWRFRPSPGGRYKITLAFVAE